MKNKQLAKIIEEIVDLEEIKEYYHNDRYHHSTDAFEKTGRPSTHLKNYLDEWRCGNCKFYYPGHYCKNRHLDALTYSANTLQVATTFGCKFFENKNEE